MTTDNKAELLPCPFCGGTKLHVHFSGILGAEKPEDCWNVACRFADCHGEIFALGYKKFKTKEQAISAWNTRAPNKKAEVVLDNKAALDALNKILHIAMKENWGTECPPVLIDIIRQALTAPAVDVEIYSFEICEEGTKIPINVEGETRFIKEVDFQKYKAARGLIGNVKEK